jgi:mono/diheme cytochrome c family protein
MSLMPLSLKRGQGRAVAASLAWMLLACLPLACAVETATGNSDQTDEPASSSPASAAAPWAEDAAAEGGEKFYDVDCSQLDESGKKVCVTDRGTYVGWRTFHATCHACHGQNAVGSSFAPSLLKHIEKERFVDVVTNGYSGQIGVMPAWGQNPNVKDFIDELYAYQQARADGALLPGRPKRKD